jgi:hypothetical protein
MFVKDLIKKLQQMDPDAEVVISGTSVLGLGCNFQLDTVHKYDNCDYVELEPGEEHEH